MNNIRARIGKFLKELLDLFLHDLEALTRDLDHRISGNPESIALEAGIFFKAFGGLFLRDLRVLTREFLPFVLRVGMQPLLFLFVFTFILPRMGNGNPMAVAGGADFGTILLPGLMAVAIMFSGIAGVALPLSSEFGITREIDDRVMCPVPLWAVALEKVCFSAMQSIIAALLVIPMARYIPAVPVQSRCASLVPVCAGSGVGESAGRILGPGDWFDGEPQADRSGLLHHRGADYVFGMRLLSLGVATDNSLAKVRCALQSHRVHQRRPSRRRHSLHRAHAMVGDPAGALLLHRRAGPLGAQGVLGSSAVLVSDSLKLYQRWVPQVPILGPAESTNPRYEIMLSEA